MSQGNPYDPIEKLRRVLLGLGNLEFHEVHIPADADPRTLEWLSEQGILGEIFSSGDFGTKEEFRGFGGEYNGEQVIDMVPTDETRTRFVPAYEMRSGYDR